MANELLEIRSKNINSIMAQRKEAGPRGAIDMSSIENPRGDQIHSQLGIDKVVLVSSPFHIDTTPQAAGDPQGRWHTVYNGPPLDTNEFSMTGEAAPGSINGTRLRGGWPVQ